MDQHRLLIADIEIFAAWAEGEGYIRERTPPHADYEALRLRKGEGRGVKPLIFFWRKNKPYATVQDHAIPLVCKFQRDRKSAPEKIAYLKSR